MIPFLLHWRSKMVLCRLRINILVRGSSLR